MNLDNMWDFHGKMFLTGSRYYSGHFDSCYSIKIQGFKSVVCPECGMRREIYRAGISSPCLCSSDEGFLESRLH
jgi:hypothetical protein